MRQALESRDYKKFADCFHENGIYERPFALNGSIDRYEGTDKIYSLISNGMAAASSLFDIISVEAKVHPCVDQNFVFVEFFLSGTSISTKETFRIASSAALIFCDADKIAIYRDFPNSAGIAKSTATIRKYADSLLK